MVTTFAFSELWGVTDLAFKKMPVSIVVITTECGIVLLSLLAKGGFQNQQVPTADQLIKQLESQFDRARLPLFSKNVKARLLKEQVAFARALSRGQLEMRKITTKRKLAEYNLGGTDRKRY